MFYRRRFDPSAYLVLWQIGVAGDLTLERTATSSEHRRILLVLLSEHYPLQHIVFAYEAATLPGKLPRVERFALSELAEVTLRASTTLVIPPAVPMERNEMVIERVVELDAELA